jgi:soluble cytochrome b562
MSASSNNNLASETPKVELNSILTQVQHLQTDREKLMKELENAKQKVEKLTEGKRAEMKNSLDTVIAKWLEDSVENEAIRSQFRDGMERLVKNTAEDSGVWQVVVCASAAHAKRLNEIERLRVEHEELKSKMTGEFGHETSRKRGRDEISPSEEAGRKTDTHGTDFWAGFEDIVRDGRGFDPAL